MSTPIAFVLGLLIGWIVEWVIDWIYWRRRNLQLQESEKLLHKKINLLEEEAVDLRQARADIHKQALEQKDEIASLKDQIASLQSKVEQVEGEKKQIEEYSCRVQDELAVLRAQPAVPPLVVPDDLEIIDGIGPVIARKLNKVGIHTFEQLAAQTPVFLRTVLGDVIQRLADEDSIIEQARNFAQRKMTEGDNQQ